MSRDTRIGQQCLPETACPSPGPAPVLGLHPLPRRALLHTARPVQSKVVVQRRPSAAPLLHFQIGLPSAPNPLHNLLLFPSLLFARRRRLPDARNLSPSRVVRNKLPFQLRSLAAGLPVLACLRQTPPAVPSPLHHSAKKRACRD